MDSHLGVLEDDGGRVGSWSNTERMTHTQQMSSKGGES